MENWNIETSHSSIDFKVRHMAISSVKGSFKTFSGTIEREDGELKKVHVVIDASSIDTNDEKRDGHLKSADFFDVENHPEVVFESTLVEKISEHSYNVSGDLRMRGVSKPVSFSAEVANPIKDPWGLTRTAASISGKLNRKDWGLSWNQVLEAGALLVGEEVQFDFDIEAVQS